MSHAVPEPSARARLDLPVPTEPLADAVATAALAPPIAESVDGRSLRWADHREARRAELVHVARRCVHHRGPDVSMEEIAAAAGTSKSIVYRYFTDKTGLQRAVSEAVVAQIQERLEGALHAASTPRAGLRAMVGLYLETIESSPHVYFFVTRGSLDAGSPLGHFLDAVTGLVAEPFARELTDTGSAPEPEAQALADAWAAGAVGFVSGAGERWLRSLGTPGALDREVLTGQVAAWLWGGPVAVLARSRSAVPTEAGRAGAALVPPPTDRRDVAPQESP